VLSPLSTPYLESSGHRIFSLTFYSEITVIEDPIRICFHDPTQELGISLNFSTQAEYSALFQYLRQQLLIVTPGLPGFFLVRRCRHSFCQSDRSRADEKAALIGEPATRTEELLSAHSHLIRRLSDLVGGAASANASWLPKASAEQVSSALSSRSAVIDLLRHHSIPDALKGDVWCFMIGLRPLCEDAISRYRVVKGQWMTITESQLQRSSLLWNDIHQCSNYIQTHQQQFVSVVVAHSSILKLAFDVFVSLLHVFHFLERHFDCLKGLFRAFLWMFVTDIARADGDGTVFLGQNGREYDEETLETLIFWSILYVLEAGETRRLLEVTKPADNDCTEAISDFIFLVHPAMFKHLHQIGVRSFERLIPLVTSHMSTLLPLCDCLDLWLAALAAPSFLEFTQVMIICCLFFNFPNAIPAAQTADQDLQPMIEKALEFVDHRYLEMTSFVLVERAAELIESRFAGQ
jgi:hypothetical protein